MLRPLLGAGKLPDGERTRVAAQLGRTESSVASEIRKLRKAAGFIGTNRSRAGRASWAGQDSKPPAAEPALVARRCLGCGADFMAPGRFIRVCGPCKLSDAWRLGL